VTPKPTPPPTRVRALEDRNDSEITFPRLMGYRYEIPAEKLVPKFTADSKLSLSSESIPTKVESAPIIGETIVHTLDDLKRLRDQEVVFLLAKRTLETFFRDDDQNLKFWFYPQVVEIARRWYDECVTIKGNTFKQLLYLAENANDAAGKIFHSIVASTPGEKVLKPILRPYDTVGSTRYVDFDTTRPTYKTKADRCHVSHVVADTDSWEQKMAQVLEDMGEVAAYVKNQNLGFSIPYVLNGEEKNYFPDFIVRVRDGQSDLLNLIVEVSGKELKDKAAKVATARNLWVPAVNNHGGYGRWAFLEISDPWDAERPIRAFIANGCKETV
jgi:type III restriction enzyme